MLPFIITQKQYNNLLAVPGFHSKLQCDRRNGTQSFYFFGTFEEHKDAMNRCKFLD